MHLGLAFSPMWHLGRRGVVVSRPRAMVQDTRRMPERLDMPALMHVLHHAVDLEARNRSTAATHESSAAPIICSARDS